MTDSSGKNNSTSVQYSSSQEREREREQDVNVFDYEVSDFDSERGSGKEMQEKPRTSPLGTNTNQATNQAPISQALDDDSEWNAVDGDEEMADHVETARP